MGTVASLIGAMERAPGWTRNYSYLPLDLAEAIWLLNDGEHAAVIERNLRSKVMVPHRWLWMRDPSLALGRLRALRGNLAEARESFADARVALDKRGARPLRAIVDYDEALAILRANGAKHVGDPALGRESREECENLLREALRQFEVLDMTGWTRRANALLTG